MKLNKLTKKWLNFQKKSLNGLLQRIFRKFNQIPNFSINFCIFISMSKYPRTAHLPYSAGVSKDDRISQTTKMFVGIEVVITEKLDGSNASLTKDGVYARSHVEFTKNPWDKEMWNIWNNTKRLIDENVFIFGENLEGIHSIEYSNLDSYFYIFGVRDNNIWVPWEQVDR